MNSTHKLILDYIRDNRTSVSALDGYRISLNMPEIRFANMMLEFQLTDQVKRVGDFWEVIE